MNSKLFFFFFVCVFFISCKKEPGEGGFASIQGKLYVKNYDASFTIVTSEYYLPGENVYIVYGNGTEIGSSVKTSYDGSFKFNYLRKGKYKIFAIGKDPSQPNLSIPKEELIEITITEKKQKKVLEDLVINK